MMSPAVCGDPGMFQDVSSDVWGSGNASECLQWCVGIRECFRMSPAMCGDRRSFKDVFSAVWGSGFKEVSSDVWRSGNV